MLALTSIEYADDYFLTKPYESEKWYELENTQKSAWLMESTRRIYAIQGFKFTSEVIELLDVIPDDLQQACCEVVLGLLTTGDSTNPHNVNKKLGISSISFGRDSVSYGDSSTSSIGLDNAIFSEYAQIILNKYIIKAYPYV